MEETLDRSASPVKMNTKSRGTVTEAMVCAELLKRGHTVSIPWGENAPYDLIVDIGGELKKVQCKTGRLRQGSVIFNLASVYYSAEAKKSVKRAYVSGTVDYFGVYSPELKKTYLIPDKDIPSGATCRLRVSPLALNAPTSRIVTLASRYEF